MLQAHGREMSVEGSSVGGVDAAFACHPSMMAISEDFGGVKVPLGLAVGSEDSMLDAKSVDKIKEILNGKPDVPTEVQVWTPFSIAPAVSSRVAPRSPVIFQS